MLENQRKNVKQKQIQFSFIVVFLFVIILVRIFYLQIYKKTQYLKASENNRIREVVLEPTRGLIFDRNRKIVVDNHPSYSVNIVPFEIKKSDSVITLISKILQIEPDSILKIVETKRTGLFTPVKLKRQIDFETLSKIEENRLDLPGIGYQIEPRRSYPLDIRAAHLLGYLGEIARDELANPFYKELRIGDIVGKNGLERVYDEVLRGNKGYSYVEVDAIGREVKKRTEKKGILPHPGHNIHLTIDADLQKSLEIRMENLNGGAIVVDCTNGEVLAMVSKPDYDPELFSKLISEKKWNELLNDPGKPLYNRLVQSVYPPGSTYKLVVAAAALEKKKIRTWDTTYCSGSYKIGKDNFNCWNLDGHGRVDFFSAMEKSCNVYFYKLGQKIGLENWTTFSKKLLFGVPTGIDLMDEKAGLLPDRKYLEKRYGRKLLPKGLLVNLSIGQGDLLVTPLQMLRLVIIIANDGIYPKLHLVRYFEDPITNEKQWVKIDTTQIVNISKKTYSTIKYGMYRVVHGKNGTAKAAYCKNIEVAGKTGTAENPHGQPHSWFVGFAPFDNPKIAICILVENGGSGGKIAAPIAQKIIKKYFTIEKSNYAHF